MDKALQACQTRYDLLVYRLTHQGEQYIPHILARQAEIARNLALEEAAKSCDHKANHLEGIIQTFFRPSGEYEEKPHKGKEWVEACARDIRALKDTPTKESEPK